MEFNGRSFCFSLLSNEDRGYSIVGIFKRKKEKKNIGAGKVISVINQKGGVGKTTIAFNICCALAQRGKRVLAIDCDPQTNLTALFGVEIKQYNLFHLLINSVKELKAMHLPVMFSDVLVPTKIDSISLLPAGQELSGFELTVAGISSPRQLILRKLIENYELRSQFDYIVIDSPPTLGLLMVNIMCASDGILVPFKPDDFSQVGLQHLHEAIDNIEEMGVSSIPEIIKYIPNLVEGRRKQDQQNLATITAEIEQAFSSERIGEVIYNRSYFAKSQSAKRSVFDYQSKEFASVQQSFLTLAKDIEEWADGKNN